MNNQKLQINPKTGFLIIDVQKGFDERVWGEWNNPRATENIARLLEAWRAAGMPVFHVQHLSRNPDSPLHPDKPGSDFQDAVRPLAGEPVFQKQVNSAFIGTNLEQQLREAGIEELVIIGLTTDHCVSTTTRMAANLGFKVYLPEDATATVSKTGFDGKHYTADELHRSELTSLHGEFATITKLAEIFEALKTIESVNKRAF